jgi:thiol-disulfide isomerase/thioredoxin
LSALRLSPPGISTPPQDVAARVVGLGIVLAAVVLALGFGGYRLVTDGRFGTRKAQELTSRPAESDLSTWMALGEAVAQVQPGERATLVQFSSAFCAPCRATRRILTEVADVVPGVVHVEVDAEHHLEVVRRLGIVRTPTTLVLDAAGREIARAAGAPRKEQVLSALPSLPV